MAKKKVVLKQTAYRRAIYKDSQSMKPISITTLSGSERPLTESEIRQGIRKRPQQNELEIANKTVANQSEMTEALLLDIDGLTEENEEMEMQIDELKIYNEKFSQENEGLEAQINELTLQGDRFFLKNEELAHENHKLKKELEECERRTKSLRETLAQNEDLRDEMEGMQAEQYYLQNGIASIFNKSKSVVVICEKIARLLQKDINSNQILNNAVTSFLLGLKEGTTKEIGELTLDNETVKANGFFTEQEWEVMQGSRDQAPESDGIKITPFNASDYSDTGVEPREDREVKALITDGYLLRTFQIASEEGNSDDAFTAAVRIQNMSVQAPITYMISQIIDTAQFILITTLIQ